MSRSDWKKEFEPFEISVNPFVWQIDQDSLVKKNKIGTYQANNNYIKIDDTSSLSAVETYGLFLGMGGVVLFLLLSLFMMELMPLNYYLILSPFFALALFHYLVYLKTGRKYIIMDRENGKLSYPQHLLKKKPITIDFKEAKILISYASKGPAMGTKLSIENRVPGSLLNGYWLLQRSSEIEYWSFMVWYMDKNRPLPHGTAFDPYREKDFERRKAAGFPTPLYPAAFDTKEATAKQQAERKKIGGW